LREECLPGEEMVLLPFFGTEDICLFNNSWKAESCTSEQKEDSDGKKYSQINGV